jgi:hypothetical protein
VFAEFLRKVDFLDVMRKHLPFVWTSPNAIDPVQTFTAFLASVLTGLRHLGAVGPSAWTLAGPRDTRSAKPHPTMQRTNARVRAV